MAKVSIIYWSGTGNTESMANLIEASAKEAGADVTLVAVSDANADEVLNSDVIVLGCPSMGDEVLEESEFEPFIESIEDRINGKKVALFGSYGWGDGQWMRDWEERMKQAGATLVSSSVIVQESPDDEEECKELGKAVAV